MTSSAITPAEWKEIEGYLQHTNCKIDETGMIWMHDADGNVKGAMHPRTFLDIRREEANSLGARAAETNRMLDQNFKDECDAFVESFEPLTQEDIRAFRDAGIPLMSEAGFEALKKQLRGC